MSCRSYVQFHDDVKGADHDEDHDGQESPKRNTRTSIAGLLEKQIAGPLSRVQTALAKETVIWKRGILVMPKVCLSCFPPTPPPLLTPSLPRPRLLWHVVPPQSDALPLLCQSKASPLLSQTASVRVLAWKHPMVLQEQGGI